MPKLYKVTGEVEAVFVVADDATPSDVRQAAERALKDEATMGAGIVERWSPQEIRHKDQIPDDWTDSCPWGLKRGDHRTVAELFAGRPPAANPGAAEGGE